MCFMFDLVLFYLRQLGTWCYCRHPHILSVLSIISSPRVPTSPVWISQVMSWQNLNFHFMEATSHLTSSSHYRYIHLLMNEWHFKPYYFLYCLLAVKYSTFQMHMFYMPIFFFLNKAAPLGNGLSSGHLMFSFLIFTYARQSCSIHRTTLLHTTMV